MATWLHQTCIRGSNRRSQLVVHKVKIRFCQVSAVVLAKKMCLKLCSLQGPVYTVRTKLENFLRSYVEGVYAIQNDAYERNNLTAYSLGGHNIVLN